MENEVTTQAPVLQTSNLAICSLVLGILSLLGGGILTGLPAIICGHIGRSQIKQSPKTLSGDGLALAGLIMGYIASIALVVIILLILIVALVAATAPV